MGPRAGLDGCGKICQECCHLYVLNAQLLCLHCGKHGTSGPIYKEILILWHGTFHNLRETSLRISGFSLDFLLSCICHRQTDSSFLNIDTRHSFSAGDYSSLWNTKTLCVAVRGPQVFCYMTSWSQKRPGAGKFTPENVDPLLCTHVIYAFATLKDHRLAAADEKDIEMYDRVIALREKNPNLKVLRSE